MKRPLLQLALDDVSLKDAFKSLENGVDEIVDIIECGTILIAAEGKKAIAVLREKYPDKPLVADFKIADSGKVTSGLLLEGRPDFLTVICSADNKTKKAVVEQIAERKLSTQVQIELYGRWTFEDVEEWKKLNIHHVVLHHSVDEINGWSKEEIDTAKKLCETGMHVTVTGGITKESLALFKGLPLFCIIAGRSIRKAENPAQEARSIKKQIDEIWP